MPRSLLSERLNPPGSEFLSVSLPLWLSICFSVFIRSPCFSYMCAHTTLLRVDLTSLESGEVRNFTSLRARIDQAFNFDTWKYFFGSFSFGSMEFFFFLNIEIKCGRVENFTTDRSMSFCVIFEIHFVLLSLTLFRVQYFRRFRSQWGAMTRAETRL